jgi:hypothetical protein
MITEVSPGRIGICPLTPAGHKQAALAQPPTVNLAGAAKLVAEEPHTGE